jgi:hypothetical protein
MALFSPYPSPPCCSPQIAHSPARSPWLSPANPFHPLCFCFASPCDRVLSNFCLTPFSGPMQSSLDRCYSASANELINTCIQSIEKRSHSARCWLRTITPVWCAATGKKAQAPKSNRTGDHLASSSHVFSHSSLLAELSVNIGSSKIYLVWNTVDSNCWFELHHCFCLACQEKTT